jgi:hypothetical protein
MRTIKLIIGIGCFVVALLPGLLVLGEFNFFFINLPFTICTLGLVGAGWFLIAKRGIPMSRKARVTIILTICFSVGFYVLSIIIPGFIAASRVRSSNACVNNLRQIDAAKQQWALENGKANGVVTESDLKPYIKLDSNGNLPKCPHGGTYTIGRLGEDPKCSVGISDWPNSHALNYTGWSWWINFKMAYGQVLGLDHGLRKPQSGDRQ